MALEANHAGTAGADHFQFDAAAQAQFIKPLNVLAAPHDLSDDPALTVGEPVERDELIGGETHGFS